jgi:2-methylcitrate dehydratase PrpD
VNLNAVPLDGGKAEMTELEISRRLIQFAVETKYEDIPEDVIEFTKALTMKTVAAMVAGADKPSGQKLATLIRNRKLPEKFGVIGSNFKTSQWEAILLNAFLGHASELEDDRWTTNIHAGESWDITVIPPLFSFAESLRLTGKALLEAIALGLEVHTRSAFTKVGTKDMLMITSALGSAVGIAKAMGLGIEETASATGLALSGNPLTKVNYGTDAHFFESALMALQGAIAAEMAKEGMTGNPNIALYMANYGGQDAPPETMIEDLGKHWVLKEIWVKKYPCCFHTHRQIDTLIDLIKEHGISYKDVEAVEVDITRGEDSVNRPEPKTEGDLQFSLTHVLACAILDGDVKLEHFNPGAIDDPRLKEARSKVKQILDPTMPASKWVDPARVTVKMKDGRELSRERRHIIGSPEEPLTMQQIRELYAKFTRNVLPEDYISRTANILINLESLPNIDELMDMLVFCSKR